MSDGLNKTYLVIGRMTGDEEDTPIVIQSDSHNEAVTNYCEQMWEMEGVGSEEAAIAENEDRGCIVNAVFVSEAPIKISVG